MSVAAAIFLWAAFADEVPPLPQGATLALEEKWASIDPARWYRPRKRWGQGNHGVIPENVRVENGTLVCEAHGDLYDGAAVGIEGNKTRVGGVVVSKAFFASGRFETSVKLGLPLPKGAVPAVWTYAYRAAQPGRPEYLSELDFPEFGKGGVFEKALYNAYWMAKEDTVTADVPVADGAFHALTTEWRTELAPVENVPDADVTEGSGFWWHKGVPLKRVGPGRYQAYRGLRATHWVDGKKVAENTRAVPCMAAQLTIGVWLPGWGGPAPWKTSTIAFGPVKVWRYDDPGDVRGFLTDDLRDNFEADGTPKR